MSPNMDKDLRPYTVAEICSILRIGRNKCYEIISKKELKAFRIGNQLRIPRKYLDEYINKSQ